MRTRRLPDGLCQVVIQDGMECGELERIYEQMLRGRLRHLVYTVCGVPDPAIDPVGYIRDRWWHPDMLVTVEMVTYFQDLNRTVYWPYDV